VKSQVGKSPHKKPSIISLNTFAWGNKEIKKQPFINQKKDKNQRIKPIIADDCQFLRFFNIWSFLFLIIIFKA
jgi:hypothetical protein